MRSRPAAGTPHATFWSPGVQGAVAAIGVAAIALAAVLTASPFAIPAFSPMGDQAAFSPVSDPNIVQLGPLLTAPWQAHRSLLTSGLVSVGVGVAALACARVFGASWLASLFVWGALAASAPFASSLWMRSPRVIGAGLLWLTLAFLGRAVRSQPGPQGPDLRRPGLTGSARVLAAAAVTTLAVASTPLALLALPVILALSWSWPNPAAVRRAAIFAASIGAVIGTVCFGWLVLAHAEAEMHLSEVPSWRELARVSVVPARTLTSSPLPDVSQWPSASLWVTLAGAAAIGWRAQRSRVLFAGLLGAGVALIAAVVWQPLMLAGAGRWAVWVIAPFTAVGVTVLSRTVGPEWQRGVVVTLPAALLAGSFSAAAAPIQGQAALAFQHWFDAELQTAVAEHQGPLTLVAEDALVDSAVAAARHAPRILPTRDALLRAWRSNEGLVLAGPSGRAGLEMLGIQFATRGVIDDPVRYRLSEPVVDFGCATLGLDAPFDLSTLRPTGRLGVLLPASAAGHLLLTLGDDLPVQLRAVGVDGRPEALRLEPLPASVAIAGERPASAVRVGVPTASGHSRLLTLHLGRRRLRGTATLVDQSSPGRVRDESKASVCAAAPALDPVWRDETVTPFRVPLAVEALFGRGWHGLEGTRDTPFRWSEGAAAVLVPSARAGPIEVTLTAAPAADAAAQPVILELAVNGVPQPPRAMSPGDASYGWVIGSEVWEQGVNELLWTVSRTARPADRGEADGRTLGLRVSGIALTRR